MTETKNARVSLSPLDSARFEKRIARAVIAPGELDAVLDFCRREQVEMLIARCSTDDLAVAQALEAAGARLMDTLVYYGRVLVKGELPEDTCAVPVRPARAEEAEEIRAVAAASFEGYIGHYHADPRLDRARSDQGYQQWAHDACVARDERTEVLVAELDGRVAGFATLRLNDASEGEGVLFAVSPEAQGRGIYRSLMIQGMRWSRAKGAKRMVVSTQVNNLAVQKVWSRLGFEPVKSFYTFHLWLDR